MKNAFLKCSLLLSISVASLLANVDTNDSYAIGATSGGYVLKGLLDQKQLGVGYDADAVIKGFSDALKSELKLSDDEIAKLLNKRAESCLLYTSGNVCQLSNASDYHSLASFLRYLLQKDFLLFRALLERYVFLKLLLDRLLKFYLVACRQSA